MRSEPARLSGISIDFSRIPPKWDEYFSYEHAGWASQAKWDRVFCNAHVYILFWNSFPIRFQHDYYEYHHEHS